MDSSELKNLIDRYLKNDVTEKERELLDAWYKSYDDIHQQLPAAKEQQLKSEIYSFVKERIDTRPPKARELNVLRYAAVAAVAIVLLVAGLFVRRDNWQEQKTAFTIFKTNTGQVKKLELPDGSIVWLNAMSRVRISEGFEKKATRNVYLDEGEAFFEVKRNPSRPFLVITNSITTRVLGTSFDVKAYKRLNYASVTLRTGHVAVTDRQGKMALLLPNQRATYLINEHTYRLSSYNGEKSKNWVEGRTVLSNASFQELALVVENIYGVKLTSNNKLTNTYKYNIVISQQHAVDETLKLICSIHKNNYRRKNNDITIY
ncbi:FecR family protein [Mucilaginibacter paludis]|uniref:Anti-FecI sigma factor, FecR n=1 Tax=Mucilaginibacter paludis DSM 18603 TaxID=714943 RepID=H1Y2A3_9SPHI|nr:FecR family protein [Mucilaginibacter paludis]EHQ27883.1 anti-FecI sigma factor, FecR [Mucilaginibacter paludis DSM 18603]